jgi:hypothetical protein
MAVDAVTSEPVSAEIPVNRGKYREIFEFLARISITWRPSITFPAT